MGNCLLQEQQTEKNLPETGRVLDHFTVIVHCSGKEPFLLLLENIFISMFLTTPLEQEGIGTRKSLMGKWVSLE